MQNFKYLNDLIHSGIKEIVLDSDIILDNNKSSDSIYAVKLDVNGLVLDGNGYAIDGNNNSCMLLCTGENITIKNIIIKNIKFQNPLMKKGSWSALTNCKGQLNIINITIH